MTDEQSLIRASQQGDHAAFECLVREHQRMILSLAYRMTGSWSDAEDLAQESFIQAFRQLDRFRGEARFSSWLYRITVNHCLNWRKRAIRESEIHEEWSQEAAAESPRADYSQQVQEALLKLKPKQRAAIVLTTYEGRNHAEAARLMGCSETTVSWHLFMARAKLKTLLAPLHNPGDAHE